MLLTVFWGSPSSCFLNGLFLLLEYVVSRAFSVRLVPEDGCHLTAGHPELLVDPPESRGVKTQGTQVAWCKQGFWFMILMPQDVGGLRGLVSLTLSLTSAWPWSWPAWLGPWETKQGRMDVDGPFPPFLGGSTSQTTRVSGHHKARQIIDSFPWRIQYPQVPTPLILLASSILQKTRTSGPKCWWVIK